MTLNLTDIEKKALAATPGPWDAYFETGIHPFVCTYTEDKKGYRKIKDAVGRNYKDVEYIAAASPDVVLALIQALRKYDEALQEIIRMNGIMGCETVDQARQVRDEVRGVLEL